MVVSIAYAQNKEIYSPLRRFLYIKKSRNSKGPVRCSWRSNSILVKSFTWTAAALAYKLVHNLLVDVRNCFKF